MKNRIRINKYLSQCGLGSRRKVEAFILSGRISINGRVIRSLSSTVDIDVDIVELDDTRLNPIRESYYLILNKPRGYITSMSDERGRPIVMDLIPERYKKAMIFPVGRLDKDTEGLLLLTNDGCLAYKLNNPKYGITKEYIVELDKPLKNSAKAKIEKGIFLYGTQTRPATIDFLDKSRKLINFIITEGKKRHIRMTFRNFSYRVKELKRVSYASIKLGKMNSGSFRLLEDKELSALKKYIYQRYVE